MVSKFLLNYLTIQFNMYDCSVRGPDEEVIAIGLYEGNLYEIYFAKVHGMVSTNLVILWRMTV
jgi:hypothetical protein